MLALDGVQFNSKSVKTSASAENDGQNIGTIVFTVRSAQKVGEERTKTIRPTTRTNLSII